MGRTVTSAGWLLSCTYDGKLVIEPEHTTNAGWRATAFRFHVSDTRNRAAIAEQGLQVGTGGNTRMNRAYPSRIFLAKDLLAAFEFVSSQCCDNVYPAQRRATMNPRERSQLDIWCVRPLGGTEFFRDVLLQGKAAYIEEPVPKERVMLVPDWQRKEQLWRRLRERGKI